MFILDLDIKKRGRSLKLHHLSHVYNIVISLVLQIDRITPNAPSTAEATAMTTFKMVSQRDL